MKEEKKGMMQKKVLSERRRESPKSLSTTSSNSSLWLKSKSETKKKFKQTRAEWEESEKFKHDFVQFIPPTKK